VSLRGWDHPPIKAARFGKPCGFLAVIDTHKQAGDFKEWTDSPVFANSGNGNLFWLVVGRRRE
jgi:hypothetical protein